MTTLNTIIEEEIETTVRGIDDLQKKYWFENTVTPQDEEIKILLTTAMQRAYEQALEDVIQKATLKENPIEDNGELIDGSYYVIYKGYLDQLKK